MSVEHSRTAAEPPELPPDVASVFQKTEALIQKEYAASPSAQELMRLWLSCATVAMLRREFEEAMAGTADGVLVPDEDGVYDERSL